MTQRTPALVLALAGVLLAAPAIAVTLCAKKSGKIVVRDDACKKRERAAVPGAVTIVGPTGGEGPQGPPGVPGVLPQEVVDSTGEQFGTLLAWEGVRAQVIATVSGVDVPLQFNIEQGDFFNQASQGNVFWDADGCSGTPFIRDAGGLVPMAHVFGPRTYFSRTVTSLTSVSSLEFEPTTPGDCGSSTDTGRQTCCVNSMGAQLVSPAEVFDTSTLGVTPPFSVVPR